MRRRRLCFRMLPPPSGTVGTMYSTHLRTGGQSSGFGCLLDMRKRSAMSRGKLKDNAILYLQSRVTVRWALTVWMEKCRRGVWTIVRIPLSTY